MMGHHRGHQNSHFSATRRADPFFSSSNHNDPFSDPFFSSGGFGGGSLFGSGGLHQMMSGHFGMMNSMMSQMHSGSMMGGFDQHQRLMQGNNGGRSGMGSSFNFTSSSSSSSNFNHGGGGHQTVSTSTRSTIVNGVRKTVTERTVVHPDGRVERHVETTGDDHGNGPVGRLASTNHPALDYDGSRRRSRR